MSLIDSTLGAVLDNFSISRDGNSLYVSAYGGGSGTSWTYDAEIHYTGDYVLSSMSEDHFQTDGENNAVQNVLWTQVYHHTQSTTPTTTTTTTPTTTTTAPAPVLPSSTMIGVTAAAVVGVIVVAVIVIRRR